MGHFFTRQHIDPLKKIDEDFHKLVLHFSKSIDLLKQKYDLFGSMAQMTQKNEYQANTWIRLLQRFLIYLPNERSLNIWEEKDVDAVIKDVEKFRQQGTSLFLLASIQKDFSHFATQIEVWAKNIKQQIRLTRDLLKSFDSTIDKKHIQEVFKNLTGLLNQEYTLVEDASQQHGLQGMHESMLREIQELKEQIGIIVTKWESGDLHEEGLPVARVISQYIGHALKGHKAYCLVTGSHDRYHDDANDVDLFIVCTPKEKKKVEKIINKLQRRYVNSVDIEAFYHTSKAFDLNMLGTVIDFDGHHEEEGFFSVIYFYALSTARPVYKGTHHDVENIFSDLHISRKGAYGWIDINMSKVDWNKISSVAKIFIRFAFGYYLLKEVLNKTSVRVGDVPVLMRFRKEVQRTQRPDEVMGHLTRTASCFSHMQMTDINFQEAMTIASDIRMNQDKNVPPAFVSYVRYAIEAWKKELNI